MGYLHIPNLYKDPDILNFKEVYALEKIHGTSAHISYTKDQPLHFFSGENKPVFEALFDAPALIEKFAAAGWEKVAVYGEFYGGKVQGQSLRYGKAPRFTAFDVLVTGGARGWRGPPEPSPQEGRYWLNVPWAERVVAELGLEFVHYVKIPTTYEALDAERDAVSVQAFRNGITTLQTREGVVLRPLIEVIKNNGERIIAKHKRAEFRETCTVRRLGQKEAYFEANKVAEEFVTETRLDHVLQTARYPLDMTSTGSIIIAMVEDVFREGSGEFEPTDVVRKAIGHRTALMWRKRCGLV